MSEKKYMPSFAELIDRLTIISQKEMFAETDEMRFEFIKERNDIIHDINIFIKEGVQVSGEQVFASILLQLVNSHIWENEKAGRGEGETKNYELTHALNSDRAKIKKHIQTLIGGRIDHKLNYNINGAWPIKF